MVTSIQLGNFFSSGGRTVLGGVGGSGLDTETLVKSLADAKALPATKLQDTITKNGKISDALGQFQTLLSKLKDASHFLSNPPGVGNQAQNAFAYTTASVLTNTGASADNYMTITTAPGMTPGTYNISDISSVASAKQQGTEDLTIASADTAFVTAVPTAGHFAAGTMTINGVDITLADNDTLNQVAAKFNAKKSSLGFTTSVIKVADNTYQLTFTANSTGEDADFDLESPTFVTAGAGVFNGVDIQLRQQAHNAVFTVNSVQITRQTNTVDDVYPGITFNVVQETPLDLTLQAKINVDTTAVKNGIVNFINAYNDLKVFAAKQVETGDDGQYTADALLANNSTFRNTMSSITSSLSQVVAGITGSNPSRLSEVGVTFADLPKSTDNPEVKNILDMNEDTLNTLIASNFQGLRDVFEFNLQSDNANLRVFSRSNSLGVNNFTLNIGAATPPALPTVTATYGATTVNLTVTAIKDNSTGNVIGYNLKGPDGSALQGLQLIYASTDAATIDVTATQGLGDQIYNITNNALDTTNGSLKTELDSIKTADERLNDQITKINDQVEKYRQQLLDKFSALEQAISKVNTLLQSLQAQSDARKNG